MTDNAIGDAGASVIAEALKLNATVTSVNLSRELGARVSRCGGWHELLLVVTRLRDRQCHP